jgi:hypothetical protein
MKDAITGWRLNKKESKSSYMLFMGKQIYCIEKPGCGTGMRWYDIKIKYPYFSDKHNLKISSYFYLRFALPGKVKATDAGPFSCKIQFHCLIWFY